MVRKAISILLIGSFFISTANFVFPYASYYANYHYFSAVACIHKAHPDMHCNGHCQLKRMLKKDHQNSATNNSKAKVDHSVRKDFFCSNVYAFLTRSLPPGQTLPLTNDRAPSFITRAPSPPPPQFG